MPSSFNNFFRPSSRRSSAVVQGDEAASIRAQQQSSSSSGGGGTADGSSVSTSSSLNTHDTDTTASSSVLQHSIASHKALPSLTTSTSLINTSDPARDVPVKSNSVPSIEVLSPTSDTPRPIWNPGEDSDNNSNASPPLGSYSSSNDLVAQLSPRSQAVLPADAVAHFNIADGGDLNDRYSGDDDNDDDEDEDDPLFAISTPARPTQRQPRKTPPTTSTSTFRKGFRPMSPNKNSRNPTGSSATATVTATSSAGLRRPSKVDTPDRHDVMRRAMAEAASTETFGGATEPPDIIDLRTGNKGTFVEEPLRSDSLTPTPHAQRQSSYSSTQGRLDAGSKSQGEAGIEGDHDKPGEGSLTFDHFGGPSTANGGELILSDGSVLPVTDKATANGGQSTTEFPSRPKLGSRNNSFQSDHAHPDVIRDSPVKMHLQQATAGNSNGASTKSKTNPGHGKYATVGHVAEPVRSKQTSLAVPGSNGTLEAASSSSPHHMLESASTNSLLNSPMKRFRRLSDVSIHGGKKGASPSGGIAGALAASGLAGMGVGHSEIVQRAQAQLSEPISANSKSSSKMSRSRSSSIGSAYAPGYEGGMYRDPVTGNMTVRGPGSDSGHATRPPMHDRMNTTESNISFDGSDISSASGLNAAASFALGLQSADDGLMPPDPLQTAHGDGRRATLTPAGIGAVGGLSPSGMGERTALGGEHEDWHQNDMGAQITGFAVASSKRNAEFHSLFPSVPEDDYLIEDYGCALVREILIQGRLYVSENHVCFYANIFGWITNIVLPFSEIVSVEKRMTAYVIPNAIQVATLHAKSTFASFLSRDTTYELIVNIWKLSHPSLRPVDTAEVLTDDESVDGAGADGATAVGHAGDVGDAATEKSKGDAEKTSKKSKRKMLKKKLGIKEGSVGTDTLAAPGQISAIETATIARASSPAANARRQPHRKTKCSCSGDTKHYTTIALETAYPAIPEKIYNLLFTSGFMKDFWVNNQKLTELQMSDWAPKTQQGSGGNMLSRDISYIKPLSGSGGFGPKQAKCLLTDDNIHVDFDEFVTTLTTTRTPDVPAGGSFSIKTKTCITWDGGNMSRVVVSCQTEWTGRSMLRSVIDRASIDGQKQYYKELDVAIRQYIKEHASEFREEGSDPTAETAAAEAGLAGGGAKTSEKDGAAGASETNGTSDIGPAGKDESEGGLAKFMDQAQPVLDIIGDLVGGVAEMSPKSLIMGAVVLLLVISNLWALMSSSGGRDPRDPHRLRTTMPKHNSARRAVQDMDASAEAVAVAVRDVLRDYFEPSAYAGGKRGGGGAHPGLAVGSTPRMSVDDEIIDPALEVQSLLSLLDEVEARVTRLRGHLLYAGEKSATA